MIACEEQDNEMVQLLLDIPNTDHTLTDIKGRNALDVARESNNPTFIALVQTAPSNNPKRVANMVQQEARGAIKVFLGNLIRGAMECAEQAKGNMVTAMDVCSALKNHH